MDNDAQEALKVVKLMFRDVNALIDKAESDLNMEHKLMDQRRSDFVNITLPDLSATTFLNLVKNFPGFAERHYVAEMFERFQPKRFLVFWTRSPKTDPTSLSLMRLKFDHWLIDNDDNMFAGVNRVTDQLETLKERQAVLAKLLAVLSALKGTNKSIPDNVQQQIVKLQKISNNYPNHPISDDFYFEEDWGDIFNLATELFIIYEAFQNDVVAETIIPEQISEPDPFDGVVWENVELPVDNSTEVIDNTSNQVSVVTNNTTVEERGSTSSNDNSTDSYSDSSSFSTD